MNKNFFDVKDISFDDFKYCIGLSNENHNDLKNKNIGLIFEKQSTRTRISFNVGINNLKGNPIEIKFEDLNFSRDETFEDTFKAMNCYLDGLIYRTMDHERLIRASKFFDKPIINALSDKSHPCQAIGDIYTLNEHFGRLNLKILWIGDMNNVCYSLVESVNLINQIELIIVTPKEISTKNKWYFQDNIKVYENVEDIDLSKIDCVMTDVFISMNDNQEDNNKTKILSNYQVNENLISRTANNSVFMHCLPAKIGFEVTEKVIQGPRSLVWKQAQNRMLAQKRLMQCLNW